MLNINDIFTVTSTQGTVLIHSPLTSVQLRRGHMILDHYNLIKLQKMEASKARLYHQKKAKVSYDQVAIAASLPKHQGIPEEIIGRRTTKGKPEYEIK